MKLRIALRLTPVNERRFLVKDPHEAARLPAAPPGPVSHEISRKERKVATKNTTLRYARTDPAEKKAILDEMWALTCEHHGQARKALRQTLVLHRYDTAAELLTPGSVGPQGAGGPGQA